MSMVQRVLFSASLREKRIWWLLLDVVALRGKNRRTISRGGAEDERKEAYLTGGISESRVRSPESKSGNIRDMSLESGVENPAPWTCLSSDFGF